VNRHDIALLGATGSIGRQVVEIVEEFPERFKLVALSAGRDVDALLEVYARHPHAYATLAEKPDGDAIVPAGIDIGEDALLRAATEPRADLVVVAISGVASLRPTLAALQADKDVAIASKEALVAGGELVMREARSRGRWLLPIDSEHSAIWQCRWGEDPTTICGITLTGSGGPFRELPAKRLEKVTVQDALKHPTWKMGDKITIDSATMMNKALEVIELHHLFDIPYDQIKVLIHPQSIVHSLVEFVDGSMKAVFGLPDMRVPISIVLGYPERLFRHPARLSLAELGRLEFETPDPTRYPAIELGFEAGRKGGTFPAVLNAANEVAVQLFLEGKIPFTRIVPSVQAVLETHSSERAESLESITAADEWARREVASLAVHA